ncbi:c-type cytochrome [Undibacterium sp. TJN25]|uniref:c-type cytochrome n=1 Tax=Undibacterium sp. TJN25 TaxID=3413056 RepID=UPI003BF0981F
MKKWLKWSGIVVGAVIVAGAAAVLVGVQLGERKLARKVEVPTVPIVLSADPAKLELGRYLFNSRGCAECHGASGGGHEVIKSGSMLVVAPNITPGPDSVTRNYQPADWARTIRHGVRPDGRPLMIMPSEDYNRMSDDDVAALVVYTKQLPPLPGNPAVIQLPLPMKLLYAAGIVHDSSEPINHALPPEQAVPAAVTAEYGAYVAKNCAGCHGAQFSGGKIPGGPPNWPAAANLTPGKGSAMTAYATPQALAAMFRSGQRPNGTAINKVMPFQSLKELNDTDVFALYAYLKTLLPRDAGLR